jgi:hypothetical protein
MSLPVDPVANLSALIRCPSVTPAEGGALTALEAMLRPDGLFRSSGRSFPKQARRTSRISMPGSATGARI